MTHAVRQRPVHSSDGARDFCDASSLSSIDSLGTITVSPYRDLMPFRCSAKNFSRLMRSGSPDAFQRCALTLALAHPRGPRSVRFRTWQRNLSGLSDTLFDWRTEQAFPSMFHRNKRRPPFV